MAGMEFGHLMQKIPKDTMPGSHKKDDFICDCGRTAHLEIQKVFVGHTRSCGNCGLIVRQWYEKKKEEIKKLKVPTGPGFICDGPIFLLEQVNKIMDPVRTLCPACKKEYYPTLNKIKCGNSLTCGCTNHRISWPAVQIAEFIRSLGFKVEFEYEVKYKTRKMTFDIFVVDKGLLIEYDGSRFHGKDKQIAIDCQKCLKATSIGFRCIRVKEVDWKENKDNVKNQIISLLA
jgi:very-short-patch-repair endonuclease